MAEPNSANNAIGGANGKLTAGQLRFMAEVLGREQGFGRAQMNELWGETFGGRRDVFKTLGYKRRLRYRDYKARYDRDSVAGRIVDVPAHYTWRSPPTIVDSAGLNGDFAKAWIELDRRLHCFASLEKLDRISGIGRYGTMLIGTAKGSSDLEKPLPMMSGQEDVLYLSIFSEGSAQVVELEGDPRNERFGKPSFYRVDLTRGLARGRSGVSVSGKDITKLSFQRIHWSRMIHAAECIDEDEVFGTPRLQRVWNAMDDLVKCVGGSAEAFWRVADRGMQIDVDKDMNWNPEDKADLETQIQEYTDDFRRIFRTRGVKVTPFGSDAVNPRGVFSVVSSLLVGTTGIPLRILFGPERGVYSLAEERAGFLAQITDRQIGHGEPNLLRQFLDRLIKFGAMVKPAGGLYQAIWPDLLKPSEVESSQTARNYAEAAMNFTKQQQLGRPTVGQEESRRFFPGLTGKPPDDAPAPNPKGGAKSSTEPASGNQPAAAPEVK